MLSLTVTELMKGPSLKLMFSIICHHQDQACEVVSKKFNINDLAIVKFKFTFRDVCNFCPFSFSLMKHKSAKNYTVKMNILCERNGHSKEFICTEHWTDWIEFDSGFTVELCNTVYTYVIDMSVIKLELKTFANFYDETDFCDFRLSTADGSGSVAVHKLCLIAYSDTFRRMLSSQWKETEAGCIEIKEVTLRTLQNLKKYIYLGILSDEEDDVYKLLLLANCYLIENLKKECIAKLAREVKPENLKKLQDFAIDHKMPELMSAIAYLTPDRTLQNAHKIEEDKQASSKSDGK